MKLSIVILNWNSAAELRRCLRSLATCTVAPREIIVVDNGSLLDDSPVLLSELEAAGAIRCIRNERNLGVGPARNQALAVAQGEYILSIDSDTEVTPGCVERLVATMDAHPELGLCAARLHAPDGSLQFTCRRFPSLQSKLCRQLSLSLRDEVLRLDELRDWDHRAPRYVDYVIGACHCMRRNALDRVGFYDPNIFYGPEDVDLCLRMWKTGWKVLYEGRAVIIHHERRVTKRWSKLLSRATREHFRGLVHYFRKHRYLLRPPAYHLVQSDLLTEDLMPGKQECHA